MRVAHLAHFRDPASMKWDIRLAWHALGHEVVPLEDTTVTGAEVERVARSCDVLLWTRTHGHEPPGVREAIAHLRNPVFGPPVPTVAQHFDRYWGLPKREAQIGTAPFWACALVCTADGGHDQAFRDRGVTHQWMPPACADRWITSGTWRAELASELCFVGHGRVVAHWRHRHELLRWLTARYGARFRWWGEKSPHGPLYGADLADLYASCAIVIGDSCNPPPGSTQYWSDRVPETLGRGGFLLHPAVEGFAEQGFVDGATLATWPEGDVGALEQQIARYLADAPARQRIAAAGQALVRARHTHRHRCLQILTALEAWLAPTAEGSGV